MNKAQIELPPAPHHPDCHVMTWTDAERRSIQQYGEECAAIAQAVPVAQAVPDGMVLVPRELMERASESLGSFVSDHGWGDADMNTFDSVCAILATPQQSRAAQPEPSGFEQAYTNAVKESGPGTIKDIARLCYRAAQLERKPLSDQVLSLLVAGGFVKEQKLAEARAIIESAHGIKE